MWKDLAQDSQGLDIEYLENELRTLKETVEIPYIDKRAHDDDLSEDLLEEVKTAFNEISNKEKTLKQVFQVMEFVLEKYSNLSEDYKETSYKLTTAEDDISYLKENIIVPLNEKIEKNEINMQEMERQLVKAETEIRDLKRQNSYK